MPGSALGSAGSRIGSCRGDRLGPIWGRAESRQGGARALDIVEPGAGVAVG
jgi:hypothetical protein